MRILIPSIQVPFINGGSTLMTKGLQKALIKAGHEVEIVTIPFKFSPNSYVSDLIDIWKEQDFNNFNGYKIDMVIALQFPAYYVKHDNKVLWLMHQHRSMYELYNEKNTNEDDALLRDKIHLSDSSKLAKIPKRFSMCENVSNRLFKYNNLLSTPVYHPPAFEENFYCEESYDYVFYPSRLDIAGDGGQRQNYESLIKKHHLEKKVKLVGFISQAEKETYYARSLGVFFAPFDEDYGYITLEAMLSSKPVITCVDSGGPLEFVEDNHTGFIIESDPKSIAKKIDWLYLNKKEAKKLGENGLESYKNKNITWDNVVNKLLG